MYKDWILFFYMLFFLKVCIRLLPKKYVHFFTDNIVHKPRLGQICHLFSRTLLSSKIVDIYIPFSKTEKKLKRKRSLKKLSLTKQGHPPPFEVLEGRKLKILLNSFIRIIF
jgi:hypothetical protein